MEGALAKKNNKQLVERPRGWDSPFEFGGFSGSQNHDVLLYAPMSQNRLP